MLGERRDQSNVRGGACDHDHRCGAQFAGRRKPGGGYTYHDFMQNRHFDIAGPNLSSEEHKKIDQEYTGYLEAQRREAIAAALAKKQSDQIQADLEKKAQQQPAGTNPAVGPPMVITPTNVPANVAKEPADRSKTAPCEDGSISCSWSKLSATLRNALGSAPRAKFINMVSLRPPFCDTKGARDYLSRPAGLDFALLDSDYERPHMRHHCGTNSFFGGAMTHVAATPQRPSSCRGMSLYGKTALVTAAIAVASAAATWISDSDLNAWVSSSFFKVVSTLPPVRDWFSPGTAASSLAMSSSLERYVESLLPEIELKVRQAKSRLAQELQSEGWRVAVTEESKPSRVIGVPLPKARPIEANLQNELVADRSDSRTLLQKLSDLLPARITLASLAPDGGLFSRGPDLASLGYDSLTAVYDISARAVYMPNGSKLEAHSGFGSLMDDPEHVHERNVGATPPNIYDLIPRERLFHGVQALRMVPVGESDTYGRSGLLTHSYLLGPNGESNGCVSIRNYNKFLSAFKNGEIKRLVVVPSLNDRVSAPRRSIS